MVKKKKKKKPYMWENRQIEAKVLVLFFCLHLEKTSEVLQVCRQSEVHLTSVLQVAPFSNTDHKASWVGKWALTLGYFAHALIFQ